MVKITETILRDAHQSLIATRMTTEQMLPIVEKLDNVGYNALEAWGGATFDASLRFLNEDPWERLRKIKDKAKKTPLQMLLRGQNLLGYKHYADDTVEAFVKKSIENGIDIIRIFDALNDIFYQPREAEDNASLHVGNRIFCNDACRGFNFHTGKLCRTVYKRIQRAFDTRSNHATDKFVVGIDNIEGCRRTEINDNHRRSVAVTHDCGYAVDNSISTHFTRVVAANI